MKTSNGNNEKRTVRAATNLTESELMRVQKEMRPLGILSPAEFYRLRILGNYAIPIIRFPAVNEELYKEIRPLHSNINQLIRQAHISGLDEDIVKKLLSLIVPLDEKIREVGALLRGEIPHASVLALAREKLSLEEAENLVKYHRYMALKR